MNPDSAPDFDELAAALKALGAGVTPADLHGSLCGYLCAGGQGVQRFLNEIALEHLASEHGDVAARAVIGRLFRSSDAELDDAEFGFIPILPDSERPVAERTEALLQWCQGFISGLGIGGFKDERALSADGREILRDLAEIAGSQPSFDTDEEVDEAAFAELVEFARVGALLLREDLRAPSTLAAGHA